MLNRKICFFAYLRILNWSVIAVKIFFSYRYTGDLQNDEHTLTFHYTGTGIVRMCPLGFDKLFVLPVPHRKIKVLKVFLFSRFSRFRNEPVMHASRKKSFLDKGHKIPTVVGKCVPVWSRKLSVNPWIWSMATKCRVQILSKQLGNLFVVLFLWRTARHHAVWGTQGLGIRNFWQHLQVKKPKILGLRQVSGRIIWTSLISRIWLDAGFDWPDILPFTG
jgi:hypothetical protein